MTSSFCPPSFLLDHPAADVRPSLPCRVSMHCNVDVDFGNEKIDTFLYLTIGRR